MASKEASLLVMYVYRLILLVDVLIDIISAKYQNCHPLAPHVILLSDFYDFDHVTMVYWYSTRISRVLWNASCKFLTKFDHLTLIMLCDRLSPACCSTSQRTPRA